MINKRLLIRNLLAHSDENSFYDKKRFIAIGDKVGKAKFLKHICALANSNPENRAYMLIGVEDEDNQIRGVDFFDDSKIQNLVNAYLNNPPAISYENVNFPHLPDGKVVGLITIVSSGGICALRKNVWKYYSGTIFFREGSISVPTNQTPTVQAFNRQVVEEIEKHARNNITLTLDGVLDFLNHGHKDLTAHYKVFQEQFVVCWAGKRKEVKEEVYYSRVDIELINEQIKLFFSALDEVSITFNETTFEIVEYVHLGLGANKKYYPLERVQIDFASNGSYKIQSTLLFNPPQYDLKTLHHVYNLNKALVNKIIKGTSLTAMEEMDLQNMPWGLLICQLNGFEGSVDLMQAVRSDLKALNRSAYEALKQALRILRKVKYA